jgi:hypothetical protein
MDVLRSTGEPAALDALEVALTLVPAVRDGEVVSVEGTVDTGPGGVLSFSGWLDLLEVLEGVVGGHAADEQPGH